MTIIGDTAFDLGGNEFLLPYMRRQFNVQEDDGPHQPAAGIRIQTGAHEGTMDAKLDEVCDEGGLPVATLRCPYIIGTGMDGLPMRIAAGIKRGTFAHIRDNEAHISVIHATDVARAAQLASGIQGAYTLTDITDPSICDLAEALAHRLNDKRLLTIKRSWARWWYGRSYFDELTTDHTAPCTFIEVFPDFRPTPVVEYLKTHVYDEQSL